MTVSTLHRDTLHRDPNELLQTLADTPDRDPARGPVREQAINAWMPLAEHLARRFNGRGEPLEDLTQAASVGLIKAVDRFDTARGRDFVAFAVPTILGEIRRHFRDHTWDLRVPRRLQELRLAISASADRLAQQLGHPPTPGELAADLQISRQEVAEGMAVGRAHTAISLDAAVSPDETGTALGELIGASDADLAFSELRMLLAPAVARLPERERQILRMRFHDNLTQTQIAERIGVSQMHISRLLSRSLAMLRAAVEDDPDEPA